MKSKKLIKPIAILLCVVIMAGFIAPMSLAERIPGTGIDLLNREVDPPTSEQMGFIDLHRVHDGRIWTDKTVRAGTESDDFEVTLSALAQSFPLTSGYTIPADTVFIIDISYSMASADPGQPRSRIALLIDALNEAIGILLNANPLNRIAVVAYGGAATGGAARVENILGLGRYTAPNNEFFTFVASGPNIRANVGPNAPRNIQVASSTPTQYGIYVGTQVLLDRTDTTVSVPVTNADGATTGNVTVTRRPNIILMTDGEPTMGWSDYTFANTTVPVPAPGSYATFSLITANEGPNSHFFGNGSDGEMGLGLFTVLTAAYRKREVHNHFFPGAWNPDMGVDLPNQPAAAVGFYTISLGPANRPLINATMDPFGNNPPAPSAGTNADFATPRLNTSYPTNLPNVPMGDLLGEFALGNDITVYARRRGAANTQMVSGWQPVILQNPTNLTLANLDFVSTVGGARGYFPATDLNTLREAFLAITSGIQQDSNFPVVNAPGNPDVTGWLVFSDVLGEYMEFRGTPTLTFPATFDSAGNQSSSAVTATPIDLSILAQRTAFVNVLYEHINFGSPGRIPPVVVASLIDASVAAGFTNSVRYFADRNRNFVASYSSTVPASADAIVEIFPMSGPSVPSPLGGTASLTFVAFHVVTALRSATFTEIFTGNIGGTPMDRTLAAGDQLIRWYVPASLIPLRTVSETTLVTGTNLVTGNRAPIQVSYRVGLNRSRVAAGVSHAYMTANASSAQAGSVYFYANRWRGNTNVTLAFYQPHNLNPWYHGDILRPVLKSTNVTGTAAHSSFSRSETPASGITVDSHWLGNNGRLTLRWMGQLTLTKAFSFDGGPFTSVDMDTFPGFDFVIRDSQGALIERIPFDLTRFTWQGAPLNRYVLTTALTLPIGTYTVVKEPQEIDLPGFAHLPQPLENRVIVPPGGTGVINFRNEYFSPLPVEDLPALRLRKIFHGLPDNVFPPNFQILVVGPEPVDGAAVQPQQNNPLPGWTLNTETNRYQLTLDRAAAVDTNTLRQLAPGNYEIHELNYDGVTDYHFDRVSYVKREINNDRPLAPPAIHDEVPRPLLVIPVEADDDIILRVDNFYVIDPTIVRPPVTPQPSPHPHPDGPPPDLTVPPPVTPQTGVDRNVILPILIIILGAGALTGAGFYLRAQKKKNETDK